MIIYLLSRYEKYINFYIFSKIIFGLTVLGKSTIFLSLICQQAVSPPYRFRAIFSQIDYIGAQSMFIVIVAAFFTGSVFALQVGSVFSIFGSEALIGAITCSSLARELAPLMAAFLTAGRSGSAITAEIVAMKTSEQLDAIDVMGVDKISYIVIPRTLGCIYALPGLAILFMLSGSIGSYIVAAIVYGVDLGGFIDYAMDILNWHAFELLFIKSCVFGIIIGSVSCYYGVHGQIRSESIGKMTTASVVMCLLLVLIFNSMITFIDIVVLK